jgi:hypothetical protein
LRPRFCTGYDLGKGQTQLRSRSEGIRCGPDSSYFDYVAIHRWRGDLVRVACRDLITVVKSLYHQLSTRLRTSRAFSAAPTIVALHLVLPCSLNIVFCPKSNGRATQNHAFRLSDFPRIQPAEQRLVADANRNRYFLGRVPSHEYDFTQITGARCGLLLIYRDTTNNLRLR